MTIAVARLEDIQPFLTKIAAGGEGVVHEVRHMPGVVFKQFKSTLEAPPDYKVLAELIRLPMGLQEAERDHLLSRTTWPTTLVASSSGKVVGYLMPALPAGLYRSYGLRSNPQNVLCDWNQISYSGQPQPPHMMSDVPTLSTEMILELLGDLVKTVGILHRNGCAVGDMSGKNLVWTIAPASTMIIDCDSFRVGGRGVCLPKESPGWIDTALDGAPTGTHSDIFKIGVAAFRALWRVTAGQTITVGDVLAKKGSSDVPPHVTELILASVAPGGRPTIDDWIARCRKNAPRPTLSTASAPATHPHADPAPARVARPTNPRPRLSLGNDTT